VDFSSYDVGTPVTLRNRFGSGSTADVMRFVVARRAKDDSAPVGRLPKRLSAIAPRHDRCAGARVVVHARRRARQARLGGERSAVRPRVHAGGRAVG
jgi:hypothetical protein